MREADLQIARVELHRIQIPLKTPFKHAKHDLAREGYDPGATSDALYVDDAGRGAFVRIDAALYDRILTGALRL